VAAEDQLKRIEVRSPQAGIVHQSSVHTIGGMVSPGEPVMLIVPEGDALVIGAKVAPQAIDGVRPGQTAFVRFDTLRGQFVGLSGLAVSRLGPQRGAASLLVSNPCPGQSSRSSAGLVPSGTEGGR
jgi:multidrug resistance efflux pump